MWECKLPVCTIKYRSNLRGVEKRMDKNTQGIGRIVAYETDDSDVLNFLRSVAVTAPEKKYSPEI